MKEQLKVKYQQFQTDKTWEIKDKRWLELPKSAEHLLVTLVMQGFQVMEGLNVFQMQLKLNQKSRKSPKETSFVQKYMFFCRNALLAESPIFLSKQFGT